MMKPRATAPAKTSPQGRSIDSQNTNRRLTKLAFWTDMRAMRAIQAAAIVEITKLVITFLIAQLIIIDRQNYVGCVSDSVTHQNTALIQGNRISRCVTLSLTHPTSYLRASIAVSIVEAIFCNCSAEWVSIYTRISGSVPEARSSTQLPSER